MLKENIDPIVGVTTCLEHNFMTINEFDETVQQLSDNMNMIKKYEHIFEGLGEIGSTYHIHVDKTVRPIIHAPRRVPVAY